MQYHSVSFNLECHKNTKATKINICLLIHCVCTWMSLSISFQRILAVCCAAHFYTMEIIFTLFKQIQWATRQWLLCIAIIPCLPFFFRPSQQRTVFGVLVISFSLSRFFAFGICLRWNGDRTREGKNECCQVVNYD